MRGSRFSVLLTCLLVVALATAVTVSVKLYGEARSASSTAAQWQAEAQGWQGIARRTAQHDKVVTRQNRALVRRYNRLVATTEARQQQMLLAVERAKQAATAKEAAAAAAAAQAAANQSYAGSSSASGAGSATPAAPAVQPAPAQAPAAAAS